MLPNFKALEFEVFKQLLIIPNSEQLKYETETEELDEKGIKKLKSAKDILNEL